MTLNEIPKGPPPEVDLQLAQNVPKNYYFLPPDTHMYMRVSEARKR